MGRLVRHRARNGSERVTARDQPYHLRRGVDSLRDDRSSRRSPSRRNVHSRIATVGGWLPRGKVLSPVPSIWGSAPISAARFLHRSACGCSRAVVAHTRRQAIPVLFSVAQDLGALVGLAPNEQLRFSPEDRRLRQLHSVLRSSQSGHRASRQRQFHRHSTDWITTPSAPAARRSTP